MPASRKKPAHPDLNLQQLRAEIQELASPEKAAHSLRFFKTGPGEYGEGDQFLGITVPAQRKLARRYRALPLPDVEKLLKSPYHEERLTALFIMVLRFQDCTRQARKARKNPAHPYTDERKAIYDLYFRLRNKVNNWDLVDSSAEHIMGPMHVDGNRSLLLKMVESRILWDRRIALLATFHFIKKGDFATTLELCRRVLADKEDLIHKAAGWMLREIGQRDQAVMIKFLDKYAATMPRTMLRYAIEKLPEKLRQDYLKRDF
ncbi:MAG: DNA alkylation repair protein [Spirochaetales bacterium]|nr:DNA alkylation repair protein [Spirochaetales bacterium]